MEYGKALPPTFNLPKGLLFLTKGDFINNPFKDVELRTSDRVMDIGAAVGAFAVAAIEQGAKVACCYEPIAKTFSILVNNTRAYGKKIVPFNAALIVGHELTIVMSSRSLGLASTLPRPQDKTIVTPALCFRDELAAFRPHVLKLDIEGGEYAILDDLRPRDLDGVRSLFIEFHPIAEREARVAKIRAFLETEGFTVLNPRLRAFTLSRKQ